MNDDYKISTKPSKLENDLCRCCHSEGSFKSLYTPYFWLNIEQVVYDNVLRECFNVELLKVREPSQQVLSKICFTCIQKLEDAVTFKRQIQKCEKRFRDIYSGYVNKDPPSQETVKEETMKEVKLEPEEQILFVMSTRVPGDGNNTDDDGNNADNDDGSMFGGDMDFKPDNEEYMTKEVNIEVGIEEECKKTKSTKRSANVKKKINMGKKTKPGKDKELLNNIKGSIKAVKRTVLKRNIDYKVTENGFECSKCQLTVNSAQNVRNHIRTVHEPKHKCPSCSNTFSTDTSFTKHKFEEHDIDHRVKCNICDNVFNSELQMKKHKDTIHKLGVKLKCINCDYETFNTEAFYRHKFKHKTCFLCKFCKKPFMKEATLKSHERKHAENPKVCKACDKVFYWSQALKTHIDTFHMLGKKMKCTECDYETYCKQTFKRHKIKHSNVKNHQCKYCQKMFKRLNTLRFHERIHTGDRRKVCTECGQAFVQRASLKYHMIKHHPGVDF